MFLIPLGVSGICNPPLKNVLTSFSSAGFAIRIKQELQTYVVPATTVEFQEY